ncbi:hypothetical protein BH23CYA1_BH23CYA1_06890 [soil metagenome]
MGIFEFVFGKGAPKNDTQTKQAYYLNDDDAKTFGNIDYMRSSKTVRRTFAKKKGKEHLESVRQISALKAAAANNDGLFSPLAQDVANTDGAQPSVAPDMGVPKSERPRRKPGSNDMDMFRNMAKDIRK